MSECEKAFENLVHGLKKTGEMLLESIGIRVKLETVPGWSEYREAKEALEGRGFFGRLWMRYGYRRLHPDRYRELEMEADYSRQILMENLLHQTMENAKGAISE